MRDSNDSKKSTNTAAQKPTLKTRIPYEVVRSNSIPNGGYNKTILITTQYSNEIDMIALGETLKFDHRDDRNAHIAIFNDKQSAMKLTPQQMLKYSQNLNDKSLDKYYKHLIGKYEKNMNTGHHAYFITLNGGLEDPTTYIKY